MTAFKAYFLIIRRNLYFIIMYICIFIGITNAIRAAYVSSGMTEGFTSAKIDVAVIDRDGGILANTLRSMLDKKQNLVEIEDNQQVIQEELFYGNVQYILVISEGADHILKKENGAISSITDPNSVYAFYVEMEVNALLNQIQVYLAGGFELEEACEKALELSETEGEVTLIDVNGNAGAREGYNYYTGFMPYAFLAATVQTMSIVIMEFKKKEIRRRMQSSSVSFFMQNAAAISAFLVVGGIIWSLCMIAQAILYKGGIFTSHNALYYVLNSLVCMLVSLSLGYLSGMLASSPAALSGINNVLSLGLCFLGGIFVPLEMLGSKVEKAAQFLPTYWYSKINGILGDYEKLNGSMQRTIWKGLFIQLLFAVACFGIMMAVRRFQLQEKE